MASENKDGVIVVDTTEPYVRMCRQAKEIQAQWKKECGDFVFNPTGYERVQTVFDGADGEYSSSTHHIALDYPYIDTCIWLPRQDQLQAMSSLYNIWNQLISDDKFPDDVNLMVREAIFHEFFERNYHNLPSFEQVWLAFVMHQKYQKRWDGHDWVQEARE